MRTASFRGPLLRSITLGSAFSTPPFTATVHSVYPQALNFSLQNSPLVFTFLTRREFEHPLSALVFRSDGKPIDFSELGLERGMSLTWLGTDGVFEGGLTVSSAGVLRRKPTEEQVPQGLRIDHQKLLDQSEKLLKLQKEKGTLLRWDTLMAPDSPVQDPFTLRFRSAAWALIAAFNGGNVDLAVEKTLELVGLGPGLTPSGDDFLYGFSLAAGILSSDGLPGRIPWGPTMTAWWRRLLERLDEGPQRTSDISISFFHVARRGLFSQALLSFAASLERENEEPAVSEKARSSDRDRSKGNDPLQKLAQLGHSSGLDSATGLLFGLYAGNR